MFAGVCRIVAVWAMVGASTAAVAQVIPPSELPGRERERFTTYPVTPFQPGAPIAGLPSAQPPPGTSDIKIVIRCGSSGRRSIGRKSLHSSTPNSSAAPSR
jgi:hypothetical protein